MENFSISQIKENEREQLIELLQEANLPVSDLPERLDHFLLARKGDSVIGSIGLEVFGPHALLRSMVVTRGMQGEGIGKLLISHLMTDISRRAAQIEEIYLITENAAKFFSSAGFEAVERATVPAVIKEVPQFKNLCPSSATVMRYKVS